MYLDKETQNLLTILGIACSLFSVLIILVIGLLLSLPINSETTPTVTPPQLSPITPILENQNTTTPANTTPINNNQSTNEQLNLTRDKLIEKIAKTPELTNVIPDDLKIIIGFFDANGRELHDDYYQILPTGEITRTTAEDYDIYLQVGEYRLEALTQTDDLCETLTQIKDSQDFRIDIKPINPLLYIQSIARISNCLSLDLMELI